MVNEAILGGLRIAMTHKFSLKDAMQSFYNSGYDKKEVEEAAQIIFNEQQRPEVKQVVEKTKTLGKKVEAKPLKSSVQPKKPSSKKIGLIILLVGILVILVGIVTFLIIFKDKLF
jgi:hypothetical protein